MNMLHSLFTWTLDVSLRASLLAGAVLCLQAALRNHISARWRYAMWLPVLLVLVAPVLPESRWSMEQLFSSQVDSGVPSVLTNEVLFDEPQRVEIPSTPMPVVASAPAPLVIDWQQIMIIVWASGFVLFSAGGASFYLAEMRRIRRTALPVSESLRALAQRVAGDLKLRRGPRIIQSPRIASPAVAGLWRSVVLLPQNFEDAFTPIEAALVLRHELMHLKRWDLPLNALFCLLQALHWFNPLLWFAAARVRQDRESACDAQVLSANESDCRSDYGHALLKVEAAYTPIGFSLGLVGVFDNRSAIRSRIAAIANHRRVHPLMGLVVGALIGGLVMLGATRAESPPSPAVTGASLDLEASADKEVTGPLIAIELKLIELPAKVATTIKLPADMQNLLAHSTASASGPALLLPEADVSKLVKLLHEPAETKIVAYPRMVTRDNHEVVIRSVVNQPVHSGDKIDHLPIGTTCAVTPRINGKDVHADFKLTISECNQPDGSDKVSAAKTLADARKLITSSELIRQIDFQPGQTALLSIALPETSGNQRIMIVSIKPSIVNSAQGGIPGFDAGNADAQKASDTGATSSFHIGATDFAKGDAIHITSVNRSDSLIAVSGDYELDSQDEATLAFYITASDPTNGRTKTDPQQRIQVKKGKGTFTLVHPHPYPGLPHVSYYPSKGGEVFGGIYFGTKEEAEASKSMKTRHRSPKLEGSTPLPDTSPVVVVSDSVEFDPDSGKWIYLGDVKLTAPRFTLSTDDRVEVMPEKPTETSKGQTKPANRGIVSATAVGKRVTVTYRESDERAYEGSSQQITYEGKTGTLTMKGWPVIKDGKRSLVGTLESTVMTLDSKGRLSIIGPSVTSLLPEKANSPGDTGSKPEASFPGTKSNGLKATINGNVLTASEVNDAANALSQTLAIRGEKPSRAELEKRALEQLIDRELVLAEFKKIGGTIKPKYIDEDIESLIKTQFNGDHEALTEQLAKQGITMKKFRETREKMIIVQVMRGKYGGKPEPATQAEIEAYYTAHSERFTDKPLDSVKADIEKSIKAERSAAEVEKWLAGLRAKANIKSFD